MIYFSIFTAYGITGVPRTLGIIQPILLLLFVGISRILARLWLGEQYKNLVERTSRPRVLIYGAGSTGRQLADALASSTEMQLNGFLDDDELLCGQKLNGYPVYNPSDLPKIRNEQNISGVLLAMPGLSRQSRNVILGKMRDAKVSVRTLPSVSDLAQGKVAISDIHELDIDDLRAGNQ